MADFRLSGGYEILGLPYIAPLVRLTDHLYMFLTTKLYFMNCLLISFTLLSPWLIALIILFTYKNPCYTLDTNFLPIICVINFFSPPAACFSFLWWYCTKRFYFNILNPFLFYITRRALVFVLKVFLYWGQQVVWW